MSDQALLSPAERLDFIARRERRASVRYPVNRGSLCSSPVLRERVWARVRNVSVDGIGLDLGSRIEPGTPLAVEVTTNTPEVSVTLLTRVVHATRKAECTWAVGCKFLSRLTEERLQDLL